MKTDVRNLFKWANEIGDANINNRILAKAMPALIKAKIIITDTMLRGNETIEVPQDIYEIIKESAQELLKSTYEEK